MRTEIIQCDWCLKTKGEPPPFEWWQKVTIGWDDDCNAFDLCPSCNDRFLDACKAARDSITPEKP